MRKIKKSENSPINQAKAKQSLSLLASKAALSLADINDKNGISSELFDRNIYGSPDVRQQLKNDQFQKCAYCESHFNGYGAVEHFRPKTDCKQDKASSRELGYWWLAYDWENLLCSCNECNSHKSCFFPLNNPQNRDVAHQNIAQEQPLLIDPAHEDPKDFIVFNEEYVLSKNGNAKGMETIKVLGLNDRKELKEKRLKEWVKFKREYACFQKLLSRLSETDSDIIQLIKSNITDAYFGNECEFVGMFENQANPIIL